MEKYRYKIGKVFEKFILHLEILIQTGGDTSVYDKFDYDAVEQKEAKLLQKALSLEADIFAEVRDFLATKLPTLLPKPHRKSQQLQKNSLNGILKRRRWKGLNKQPKQSRILRM